jgi:hypothetical protein
MNEEFIPYNEALELKELGFDEPCFGLFHNDKTFYPTQCKSHEQFHGQICSAPLYQQVFRWFREKYKLKGHIEAVEYLDGTPDTYHWCIFNKCNSGNDQLTYEEAELECLKKLIEIVKNK